MRGSKAASIVKAYSEELASAKRQEATGSISSKVSYSSESGNYFYYLFYFLILNYLFFMD
jgi:hypothetical protein